MISTKKQNHTLTKCFIFAAILTLSTSFVAAADPASTNKLTTFEVGGICLGMPIAEFKDHNLTTVRSVSRSSADKKVDSYGAFPVGGRNRVYYYAFQEKICRIEVSFPADQIAKMGGTSGASDKLVSDFGAPQRVTQVPDLGTFITWSLPDLGRQAEFILFPEGGVLNVLDIGAEKIINPPPSDESATQIMLAAAQKANEGLDNFQKNASVVLNDDSRRKAISSSDRVSAAYAPFRDLTFRANERIPLFRGAIKRIVDGDTSSAAKDGLKIAASAMQWYADEIQISHRRLVRLSEELQLEDDLRRDQAKERDAERGYGSGMTTRGYGFLRDGMSKWEADAVLGAFGTEQASSGSLATYCWQDGLKIITATFDGGKLISKAQTGL